MDLSAPDFGYTEDEGNRRRTPTEVSGEAVSQHQRIVIRPLLTLSRLLGTAPYALHGSSLRQSLPATVYSTLLLGGYSVVAYFYVTILWRARYRWLVAYVRACYLVRLSFEVGVGLFALVTSLSTGLKATSELLVSAEKVATLLAYQPLRAHRLLVVQACVVLALLPLYLYFIEEEFLGELTADELPYFLLSSPKLVVVNTFRALAFLLNACVAIQLNACLMLTSLLWKRYVDEMKLALERGSAMSQSDAQALKCAHLALKDLVDKINSKFGLLTSLQVTQLIASIVMSMSMLINDLLIAGPVTYLQLAARGSSFRWLLTPKVFVFALCFAQLLSMSVPCYSIESASAQGVQLVRRLVTCLGADPDTLETTLVLNELASQKVRLETAMGVSLGASLFVYVIGHSLVHITLILQFNCFMNKC